MKGKLYYITLFRSNIYFSRILSMILSIYTMNIRRILIISSIRSTAIQRKKLILINGCPQSSGMKMITASALTRVKMRRINQLLILYFFNYFYKYFIVMPLYYLLNQIMNSPFNVLCSCELGCLQYKFALSLSLRDDLSPN